VYKLQFHEYSGRSTALILKTCVKTKKNDENPQAVFFIQKRLPLYGPSNEDIYKWITIKNL
jgi:hypothetical protein